MLTCGFPACGERAGRGTRLPEVGQHLSQGKRRLNATTRNGFCLLPRRRGRAPLSLVVLCFTPLRRSLRSACGITHSRCSHTAAARLGRPVHLGHCSDLRPQRGRSTQPTQPHLTHAGSGLMLACSSASEMLRLKVFGVGVLSRPSLRLRGNLGRREPRWFGLVNPLTVPNRPPTRAAQQRSGNQPPSHLISSYVQSSRGASPRGDASSTHTNYRRKRPNGNVCFPPVYR